MVMISAYSGDLVRETLTIVVVTYDLQLDVLWFTTLSLQNTVVAFGAITLYNICSRFRKAFSASSCAMIGRRKNVSTSLSGFGVARKAVGGTYSF